MVGSNDRNPLPGPGSLITPTAVGSFNTVTLSRLLLLELLQFLSFLFLHLLILRFHMNADVYIYLVCS